MHLLLVLPRTTRFALAALGALTTACGTPTAPAPNPPPPASASAEPAPAWAAPPAPSAAAPEAPLVPPELALPKNVACEIGGESSGETKLHAAGARSPWGTVFGTLRFALPAEGDGAPVVTGTTRWARIRSETALEHVRAHAAKAIVFGGVFVPSGYTPLSIRRVTKDAVTVMVEAATFKTRTPLSADVACADLTLDGASRPADGVAPSTAKAESRVLPSGDLVPISATADGQPIGTLEGTAERGLVVQVVEKKGAVVRIVARLKEGIVFGYVPAGALAPLRPKQAGLLEAAFGIPVGKERPVTEQALCPRETPLLVEVGGEKHRLGAVLPEKPMILGDPQGKLTRVSFLDALTPIGDALLLVPTEALRDCRRRLE